MTATTTSVVAFVSNSVLGISKIQHQIQSGKVKLTEGTTDVKFNMPNGGEMFVSITGTCDPRINAVYAYLFANLRILVDDQSACRTNKVKEFFRTMETTCDVILT